MSRSVCIFAQTSHDLHWLLTGPVDRVDWCSDRSELSPVAYGVRAFLFTFCIIRTPKWEMYLWTCAPSEDSDQLAHSRSLIRIFTGRILDSQGCKVSSLGAQKVHFLTLRRLYIFMIFYQCHYRGSEQMVERQFWNGGLEMWDYWAQSGRRSWWQFDLWPWRYDTTWRYVWIRSVC